VGCGSGRIALHIAPYVKSITGIDPEPWPYWKDYEIQHENLTFIKQSTEQLPLVNNSIDIVVCNQVYEHVDNPELLISEIYRVLKPGGYCYFAGPNLLFPIEPHVFWPFIHWLPRKLAIKLMHLFHAKIIIDANSTTYWTLKKWFQKFEVLNIVPDIIKNPGYYGKNNFFWRALSILPIQIFRYLAWLSPGFVFILKKNSLDGSGTR
jgi:ubiquinone/menaquinone biosynthesis C-methylase UbiE